jgi:hypothetical protein
MKEPGRYCMERVSGFIQARKAGDLLHLVYNQIKQAMKKITLLSFVTLIALSSCSFGTFQCPAYSHQIKEPSMVQKRRLNITNTRVLKNLPLYNSSPLTENLSIADFQSAIGHT